MFKQEESAAYHEAGHMTAAVVQGMPIRASGLHVDLCGRGCADYFQRLPGDNGMTDRDQRERKRTIIALYAAHFAQLKFYPDCNQAGWRDDFGKIEGLFREMHPDEQTHAGLQERAEKLVDAHYSLIEELAKTLLSKECTAMSEEDKQWGLGLQKRHMPGSDVAAFFAKHNITAKIVSDDVRNYDSDQNLPHYDSLA
jgi:hypothetical protein